MKIITEEKIIKPSERIIQSSEISASDKIINQEKLSAHLKGDLDNIILKAMHKDPLRRYDSVEQFSEDIRRHLIGLPVIAQKDTAGYRLNKFIKRHKVGFVSSVGFFVFLIASLIAIIWQANIAAKERDNAKLETQKVESVNNFFMSSFYLQTPPGSSLLHSLSFYSSLHHLVTASSIFSYSASLASHSSTRLPSPSSICTNFPYSYFSI